MCSLSTLVLLFAITTLAYAGPVSKRQTSRNLWTAGRIADECYGKTCKCYTLPKKVSDYCGYSTTVLPNARGHETVEEAQGEFEDFAPLLTDSPCSDHVGPLLCLHYFPFLNCTSGKNVPDTTYLTKPCNDTCFAVTKTESCTTHVNATTGTGWPPHLNCTNEDSFPRGGVCGTTDATISKNYITKGPSCPICPKKAKTCNNRNAANSNSFGTRNKYSYAINATITGQTNCTTYQMTVHKSFNLHTCNGGVMQAPIPIATGTATLHTSDGHCSDLKAKMNTPVLIAGIHTGKSEDYQLQLGCTKKTGLIADWISKYDNLNNWVARRTC